MSDNYLNPCPRCKGDPDKTLDVFIRGPFVHIDVKEHRYIECTCGIQYWPRCDSDTFEKIQAEWNNNPTNE